MSKVVVRETGKIYQESYPKGATFLYDSTFGKIILRFATKRFFSLLVGKYMDTKFSTRHISKFIKSNSINMKEYPQKKYKSFNEFFSRKINLAKRPFSKSNSDFIAPCDSRLLVYKINENKSFKIKGRKYTISEILRDEKLANEYNNGYLMIFRLAVDDYHRYHFIDDGTVLENRKINGKFHTVGPIAFKNYKVFQENQREYSILNLRSFGKTIYMEVGALMVGKIVNHNIKKFIRGEEKGYFLFGGSTVIIMVKENIIKIDDDILNNSLNDIETKVKFGEKIAMREVIKK